MIIRASGQRGQSGRQSRAWRNRNPGNLRIRTTKPPVDHVAIDNNPGGPFGIYGTETEGWADLVARLIQLHGQGKDTIHEIISIWAPQMENDTNAYIQFVSRRMGIPPHQPIDPRKLVIARGLALAICAMEGRRSDPAWDEGEREAGLLLGGAA